MKGKVQRIFTWNEFKEKLIELLPREIYYAQGNAPLSTPPVELRLTFVAGNVQYVFVDTADEGILRRTGIPVSEDAYGNAVIKEDELKKFIYSELERTDLEMRSFELMGGY